jgi:selenocysteine lyase/cysteine desulfurase
MLELHPDDIGLLGSASEGIAQVVSSFSWQPGDVVVTAATEFPSGLYALARLQQLGVELRVVQPRDWYLDVDDLIAACDGRTRLVITSHVSYLTGQRLDLQRLAAGVHGAGAALLVDATHALGVVPVPGRLCDFVVSSCYKWLLGTHMGILAWNRRAWPRFEPMGIGWRSAEPDPDSALPERYLLHPDATRAELGNPNHMDVYVLDSALEYLHAVGLERICAYVLALGRELRAGLADLGLPLITPALAEERAGNICFLHPQAEALARLAAPRGILIWGGDGRVRSSVHLYVTQDDIAAYLAALPGLLAAVRG